MEGTVRNRTDVEIYLRQWTRDMPTEPGEEPNIALNCRVFINGSELENAISAQINASEDFTTVDLKLAPSSLKVIGLNSEEWDALGDQ